MKWAIILLIALIMIPSVLGLEMCTDIIEPYKPCKMQSPSLSCSLYNYTIYRSDNGSIAKNGTLTSLNSDIYYFNFTLGVVGDYIVELCDKSTREVKIEVKDNMLAIIQGISIMILILVGLGYLNLKTSSNNIGFWIGFLSFSLAVIEVIFILALLLARESGKDIVPLLQINFYIMLVLGFGVFMTSMILLVLNIMDFQKDNKGKWDYKWGG